jgi:hypothetical protein
MRVALEDLRKTLAEGQPEEDFDVAADVPGSVWARRTSVTNPDLAGWDELAQLAAFEITLAGDPTLDPDYFAAVKTVRDWLTHGRHEQSSMN